MTPAFSVCIPVRNEARFIGVAIESVLAQTHDDFELVIGDNASTDGLADLVARYDDPRLRYHRFDELVPVNESFNRTVALARGRWIHPLSADDRMRPTCLERMAEQIEKHDGEGVVMVVGAVRRVDVDGHPDDLGTNDPRQRRQVQYRPIGVGVHDASSWMMVNAQPGLTPFMPGSISFRRDTVVATGFFRPDMELCADGELILRMSVYGPVAYFADVVLDYTVRGDSATNGFVVRDLERNDRTTMLERCWDAALRLHAERREVGDEELVAIRANVARSLLQRALWHRRLDAGHGRPAAFRDAARAVRMSPRQLLSPMRAAMLLGALVAPRGLIEAMTEVGHRFGVTAV